MPISRNRSPRPTGPAAPGGPPPPAQVQARRGRKGPLGTRLLQRVLIALLAGCALLALQRFGMLAKLGGSVLPQQLDWNNDYQLVEHLRGTVTRDGLTHDDKECLLFIIDGNDPPSGVHLQVMEKHSGSCPGVRGSLPKLFTLLVNRQSHAVQTDAGSPGLFHPLP